MTRGIGGHQRAFRGRTDDWLTPPYIIQSLGEFDLDPCASLHSFYQTAKKQYTVVDDGLLQKWEGRVWLNPPYGPQTEEWLARLAAHGNGVALIFARTETRMFFKYIWDKANAVLFIRGRLTFYTTDGAPAKANSGGPSVLVAYGETNASALQNCNIEGKLIQLRWSPNEQTKS